MAETIGFVPRIADAAAARGALGERLSSAKVPALALILLAAAASGAGQDDPHAACGSSGWVPRSVLDRPVERRQGTGNAHEAVTTVSAEAQAFCDQGLDYLHGYVWIEAGRSFRKALPERLNIVVTRDRGFHAPGVVNAYTLDEALRLAEESRLGAETMVIGGAQIFALVLPVADRIYLTELDIEVEGDTFLPPLAPGHWREAERVRHGGPPPMSFVTLDRVR